MKNIVIFGGAFDPIHFGHMNMAINASKFLDADVYFVPARVSVWKNKSTDVKDRIAMISLAIKQSGMDQKLKISRVEADSNQDINYTIDTIKQFKRAFPQDQLYLLIGTDQVNSFDKWKCASEIASLAQIIYFERGGLELDSKLIKQFNMMKISGDVSDASSTKIRDLLSLDTPYEVIDYIISHNLYFVNKLKLYLSEDRYAHSVSVAKLAYQIAHLNRLNNPGDFMIAGLLHDIGKNLPFDRQLQIMNQYFPEYIYLNRKIYHQFTGAYLAKNDFGMMLID